MAGAAVSELARTHVSKTDKSILQVYHLTCTRWYYTQMAPAVYVCLHAVVCVGAYGGRGAFQILLDLSTEAPHACRNGVFKQRNLVLDVSGSWSSSPASSASTSCKLKLCTTVMWYMFTYCNEDNTVIIMPYHVKPTTKRRVEYDTCSGTRSNGLMLLQRCEPPGMVYLDAVSLYRYFEQSVRHEIRSREPRPSALRRRSRSP